MACSATERRVSDAPQYAPREVRELARYQLWWQERVLGAAVHLEIVDPIGPLRFWRFENRNGAWVGHATDYGRFSRRVPFQDGEEDLGVWPMATGVAQLMGVSGPVTLRQVAAADDPASDLPVAPPPQPIRR